MATFNQSTLRAFQPFQDLAPNIRSIVFNLLKEQRLNGYGTFKRTPNVWLLFRSDTVASIDDKGIKQSELTVLCKAKWDHLPPGERDRFKVQAETKHAELLAIFPDYQYRPMSQEERALWMSLGTNLRRTFWLANAVRIAERIANPKGQWEGFLSFAIWAKANGLPRERVDASLLGGSITHTAVNKPAELQSPLSAQGSSNSTGNLDPQILPTGKSLRNKSNRSGLAQVESTTTHFRGSHPYKDARPITSPTSQKKPPRRSPRLNPPPEWLKSVLIHLGPPLGGSKRRRLVLAKFQEEERTIWVEEEIEDDVPNEVVELLSQGAPVEDSTEHFIVRNYTNPWIPESMDEDGRLHAPMLRSISEYSEYLTAYYASESNRSPFMWCHNPMHPAAGSPLNNDSPTTSPISNVATPQLILDDSPTSQYSDLSPEMGSNQVLIGRNFVDEEYQSTMVELDGDQAESSYHQGIWRTTQDFAMTTIGPEVVTDHEDWSDLFGDSQV